MLFLFVGLLFIATFLQGTITPLPLVLVCLLCLAIITRDATILFFALLVGIVLDIVTVHPVGGTSLFFLIFLIMVFLYQRKYEIDSYPFVAIAAFIGSLAYLMMWGYQNTFGYALLNAIIAVILFGIVTVSQKLQRKKHYYK